MVPLRNAFTIDLEDWYCSRALEGIIPRDEWSGCESRIVRSTRPLLDLLDAHRTEATVFVLGYVAEREPDFIREIADRGHEIATHGYFHQHLGDLTPEEFARDLDRAIEVTERASGRKIGGYRAPIFSITPRTVDWAVDIIRSRGLWYDSSIMPTAGHPEYGFPGAPLHVHQHRNGLVEVPISCAEVMGRRVPATGGGWFRHLPYGVSSTLFHRVMRVLRPVVFYVHPWEIDPDPPRLPLPMLRRLRHYHGLDGMFGKIETMLREHSFTSIETMLYQAGYDRIERAELVGA
jgi:polysaccharide deacetylase family protein (PEP-CTERM system associated)